VNCSDPAAAMTPAASRWSGLEETPVQVAGVVNAYTAMLAERAGFRALYLSGSGVATASFGLPDLGLTTLTEVAERIAAAVSARVSPDFAVVGRTDALAVEGLDAAVERAGRYVAAGADVIFLEGAAELRRYSAVAAATGAPVLANLTEFGLTPLFTVAELAAAGVSLALYPLSAFRAMSAAAVRVFAAIRADGTQASVLPEMQTRAALYEVLDYEARERQADLRAAGTT
jgi:methylisocitrate lyase